jgi:HEAT repeat protein
MLYVTQVLPFLIHPHADVRSHAAKYVGDLGDACPIDTADQLWHAIDRFGDELSYLGTKQRQQFLGALSAVPQSDSTVTRAIGLLGERASDPDCVYDIYRIFETMRIDLLEARQEEILPAVSNGFRELLKYRLSLRQLPPEELWTALVEHAEHADNASNAREVGNQVARVLIDALGVHPDIAIPLAIAVLQDPQDCGWLEIWCTELLGNLRHLPAIDLLIEKMGVEDAGFLRQSAGAALGQMPAESVVAKLETAYAGDDPFYRMAIAESLAQVKHPLAESALIRLLSAETSESAITGVATALCDLCTTEGLEPLRQVVIAGRYDAKFADVKELLITVATMTDYAPPELPEWKAQMKDPVYKKKQRDDFLVSFGMNEQMVDQFRKYLLSDPIEGPEEEPAVLPRSLAAPGTIRRSQAKIGRNDPCPCGSGKKYKKCCGK